MGNRKWVTRNRIMPFSGAKVLAFIGNKKIENNPKAIATMMSLALKDQDLPVNNEQLLIYCQYDERRSTSNFTLKYKYPIGADTIVAKLRKYCQNWYVTHIEWLNDPLTAPKSDPLAE